MFQIFLASPCQPEELFCLNVIFYFHGCYVRFELFGPLLSERSRGSNGGKGGRSDLAAMAVSFLSFYFVDEGAESTL